MDTPENIVVYTDDPALSENAAALAEHIGVPLSDTPGELLTLKVGHDGVTLTDGRLSLRGDFTQMLRRVTNGRLHHEMLVRMAKTGAEHPVAVDATAGLGEDALLLAAAGYEVLLFEQDAVIAALLRDALRRAADHPVLKDVISRMELIEGDSIALMPTLSDKPDVVYLDPMFPERRKSGLINKKLQLLQKLERPCSLERELLNAAASLHPQKIIVKRPLKGAFLAGQKPTYSVKGKAIRYDCIVPR